MYSSVFTFSDVSNEMRIFLIKKSIGNYNGLKNY